MRTIPFIIIAVLAVLESFFAGHPAYTLILASLLLFVAAIAVAVSYIDRPSSWGCPKLVEPFRSRRWTWITISICVALTVSVLITHWPLRLSYAISQASLEKVAKQVESGVQVALPQSAGLFDIEQAHFEDGLVSLWINAGEDMGEPVGFIQGSPTKTKAYFSDYDVIVLDNDWCLVSSL